MNQLIINNILNSLDEGGLGSGHWSHLGRAGKLGGSLPGRGLYYPSQRLIRKSAREASTIGAIFYDYKVRLLRLVQIKPREFNKWPSTGLINRYKKNRPITPISVRRQDRGKYTVIEGHNRFEAAKQAGKKVLYFLEII